MKKNIIIGLLVIATASVSFAADGVSNGSTGPNSTSVQQGQTSNQSSQSQASNAGNQQGVSLTIAAPQPLLQSTQTVDYRGNYTVKNVPSVGGPNLTTSNDTCMGSSSGGVNIPGAGLSLGTTWTDVHCQNLKMSRELWNKGMKAASLAVDCEDPTARKALEITGTVCPQSMTVEQRRALYGEQASAQGAVVAGTDQTSTQTSNDPYIARRMSGK